MSKWNGRSSAVAGGILQDATAPPADFGKNAPPPKRPKPTLEEHISAVCAILFIAMLVFAFSQQWP